MICCCVLISVIESTQTKKKANKQSTTTVKKRRYKKKEHIYWMLLMIFICKQINSLQFFTPESCFICVWSLTAQIKQTTRDKLEITVKAWEMYNKEYNLYMKCLPPFVYLFFIFFIFFFKFFLSFGLTNVPQTSIHYLSKSRLLGDIIFTISHKVQNNQTRWHDLKIKLNFIFCFKFLLKLKLQVCLSS